MTAPARVIGRLPNGQAVVFRVGVDDSFGVEFIDRNGQPRDISTDTVTVATKLGSVTKTLTIAKDSPNTDGKATVTVPAAQVSGAETLYIDVKLAKSGGNAQITHALQFAVVVGEAG